MTFTNPANLTNVTSLLSVADSFIGGLLGIGIWLIILFGSLFMTSNFGMKDSFIASSFILMVTSFFLKYLNLIGDTFLWLPAIMFIVALIIGFAKGADGA